MRRLLYRGLSSVRENGLRSTVERAIASVRNRRDSQAERQDAARYHEWLSKFDLMDDRRRDEFRRRLEALDYQPLISVLLPVYNPPEIFLKRAIESVSKQLYTNWELCIADDESTKEYVAPLLKELAENDPRVRVVFREENGHISAASNSALELARGDFVALLDHDDELHELALFRVVEELNRFRETELIYSDEDTIDEEGHRSSPHFKPDWNPDLFLGQNYLNHLTVYRTQTIRTAGGFRKGFEGSQDYDLALRVVEQIPAAHIRHVPHVLYHWRAIPGSVALGENEKSYTVESARRALTEYLQRTSIQATVTPQGQHPYQIRYRLPEKLPSVHIVGFLPAGGDGSANGLRNLLLSTGNADVMITLLVSPGAVFTPSTEVGSEKLKVLTAAVDAASFNHAVRQTEATVVLFLNISFVPGHDNWLVELLAHALRPEVGAVGGMLQDAQGRIQHAGFLLGSADADPRNDVASAFRGLKASDLKPRRFRRIQLVQNFSAVSGDCLMVRRDTFEQLGGFDQVHTPRYFYAVDFCLRIGETGKRVLWTPYATLQGPSRPSDNVPSNHERTWLDEAEYLRTRWERFFKNDPYYNPNLDLTRKCYDPAFPPRVE
jgi:O-antigen biosynthesis protein